MYGKLEIWFGFSFQKIKQIRTVT